MDPIQEFALIIEELQTRMTLNISILYTLIRNNFGHKIYFILLIYSWEFGNPFPDKLRSLSHGRCATSTSKRAQWINYSVCGYFIFGRGNIQKVFNEIRISNIFLYLTAKLEKTKRTKENDCGFCVCLKSSIHSNKYMCIYVTFTFVIEEKKIQI